MLRLAERKVAAARAERDSAIVAAVRAGHSQHKVAAAAGVSQGLVWRMTNNPKES